MKRSISLLLASIAIIFLSSTPGLEMIVAPVKWFVTCVHEICHGLAAILTGGRVHSISIHSDFSGLTMTSGGINWVISFAGYMGTALIGSIALKVLSKYDDAGGLVITFYTVLMFITSYYALIGGSYVNFLMVMLGCGGFAMIAMLGRTSIIVHSIASFFSIQLLLNAFYDIKTLIVLTGTGVHTDAVNMQNSTGIPAIFWACLWLGLSGFFVLKILMMSVKDEKPIKRTTTC